MKTGLGDSASRSGCAPIEGGALSFGIRENGTVEGLNVETYYQPCVGIITDRERRCLRVFADDGATDIETRVLFSTLETDGWTPPSTGADTGRHGSNLPESAPVPDNGSPKQDDPAPVCAPLSAAAAPAGWKLVPVEPTPEMLSEIKFYDGITDAAMAARYKGMLAAAPCAPTSAAIDDDALTVAYMVGYAKGKDGALASPVGTVAWADRRDALRYRWLRDPAHSLPDGGEPFLAEEALDAAIDAALASPAGTAQPTSAAPAGVQPVAWQWRRKGEPWTLEKTFNSEVFATTPDSEVRRLYAGSPPTPASEAVAARNVRLLTQEEVIDAMRTDYGPRPMSRVEAIQHKFCEANSIVLPFQQEEEGKHDAVAKDAQQK